MTLSYHLGHLVTILVKPTRRQRLAGKLHSTFYNIWDLVISPIGVGNIVRSLLPHLTWNVWEKIARHTVFDIFFVCQEKVNKKCPSPSWNWQCFSEHYCWHSGVFGNQLARRGAGKGLGELGGVGGFSWRPAYPASIALTTRPHTVNPCSLIQCISISDLIVTFCHILSYIINMWHFVHHLKS